VDKLIELIKEIRQSSEMIFACSICTVLCCFILSISTCCTVRSFAPEPPPILDHRSSAMQALEKELVNLRYRGKDADDARLKIIEKIERLQTKELQQRNTVYYAEGAARWEMPPPEIDSAEDNNN